MFMLSGLQLMVIFIVDFSVKDFIHNVSGLRCLQRLVIIGNMTNTYGNGVSHLVTCRFLSGKTS